MYHTQTNGSEEETWQDLRRLGYNARLKLEEKDGPDGKVTRNEALQAKLDKLLALAEAGDVEGFVSAFVPSDLTDDEKADYIGRLKEDGGSEFKGLTEEIRCCATGQNVFKIEDEGK